jgi:recombinational DNA repair protein (RecF pathway)
MQGYIINTTKVKDEDLLVTILSKKKVKTLYRFYGARHSNIHIGYKIDFEAHPTNKENFFQLRNVSHLSYKWFLKRDRFYIWQQFLKLLHKHLRDINEIDEFYYNLLDSMSIYLEKEDPKRVSVESYVKILDYEGRIYKDFFCFICNTKINGNVVLVRAYLPACQNCIDKKGLKKKKIIHLFEEKNSILLGENEIDDLYTVMLEGF